ncbi:ribokinase [Dysosmobacter sp.]
MRVLNFGSLNLDHVYHVSHFPQPGETLSAAGYGVHLGGKGFNQSVAMARAGLSVCHAGCIGGDGLALREFLVDNGVDVSLLQTVAAPTGHAVIEVDQQGQNRILLYGGANLQVDTAYIDSVLSQFSPGDVLVLQNEISCLSTLVEKAVHRGLRIVLNPSPIGPQLTPQLIAQAEYLILNELEGGALSGQSQPLPCLRALLARCPHSKIVLTLGEAGAFYADEGRVLHQRAMAAEAVDTSAAGDTFTGFFLGGLFSGQPVEAALRIAAQAAAIAVSRPGAAESIPLLGEVSAFF